MREAVGVTVEETDLELCDSTTFSQPKWISILREELQVREIH